MLSIRYSATSSPDVEGTREELLEVREAILDLAATGAGSHVVEANGAGSPAPYDTWLRRLALVVAEGPTRVSVREGGELHVAGDPACLHALASFFDVPVDAREGWHSHHEYYHGNRWVAEDSEPIVVSLRP